MKRKLLENYRRIEHRVAEACAKARRDPKNVRVVTVTKYASPDVIWTLIELGVTELGESRVQELTHRAAMVREWIARRSALNPALVEPHWHLIGHLQRNKVRAVLPWVSKIQSLDSLRLAEEIDGEAGRLGRRVPVLLQVNSSGETSKHGVAVPAATHLAEQIASLRHLELRGLMTMAPLTDDINAIRNTFGRTRELFDEIAGEKLAGPHFTELSMGMSNDFEQAIEFGATIVRIGSAVFEGLDLPAQSEPVEQS